MSFEKARLLAFRPLVRTVASFAVTLLVTVGLPALVALSIRAPVSAGAAAHSRSAELAPPRGDALGLLRYTVVRIDEFAENRTLWAVLIVALATLCGTFALRAIVERWLFPPEEALVRLLHVHGPSVGEWVLRTHRAAASDHVRQLSGLLVAGANVTLREIAHIQAVAITSVRPKRIVQSTLIDLARIPEFYTQIATSHYATTSAGARAFCRIIVTESGDEFDRCRWAHREVGLLLDLHTATRSKLVRIDRAVLLEIAKQCGVAFTQLDFLLLDREMGLTLQTDPLKCEVIGVTPDAHSSVTFAMQVLARDRIQHYVEFADRIEAAARLGKNAEELVSAPNGL